MKLRLFPRSFFAFFLIFVAEVYIALYVNDSIIRLYGGDILMVIMIYFFIKSFVEIKPLYLSIGVLLFAYMIEVAQYFRLVEVLGFQDNKTIEIVLGSTFSWEDMLAYTVGALICYLIDRDR